MEHGFSLSSTTLVRPMTRFIPFRVPAMLAQGMTVQADADMIGEGGCCP